MHKSSAPFGHQPKLPHHAYLIADRPAFDSHPILKAHDVNNVYRNLFAGGRNVTHLSRMRAAQRRMDCRFVSVGKDRFGNELTTIQGCFCSLLHVS